MKNLRLLKLAAHEETGEDGGGEEERERNVWKFGYKGESGDKRQRKNFPNIFSQTVRIFL